MVSPTCSPYVAFLARRATSIFSPWMPVGRMSFVRKKHPSACPSCPWVLISAQSARHCQQNWWLHCEPTKNIQQLDHASEQGWNFTRHMKTSFPFLDPDLTTRTRFRICPNPFSRFRKIRIAIVPQAFIFIACQSVMPRHFVSEAHLEATLLARDLGVDRGSLIQLSIFTKWCETPAKTWVIGEMRLQKKLLISNAVSETSLKHARQSWAILSNSFSISKLVYLLVAELPATLGTGEAFTRRWPSTNQWATEMLCCACSANFKIMIALLNLACRKDKNVPHPWTLEPYARGLPRIYISIVDIKHSLAANHTCLWSASTAEKLEK
jgi:hypothetical protein